MAYKVLFDVVSQLKFMLPGLTLRLKDNIMYLLSYEGFGRDHYPFSGAEGESENSQAKGPDLDDTLESAISPKKQLTVA